MGLFFVGWLINFKLVWLYRFDPEKFKTILFSVLNPALPPFLHLHHYYHHHWHCH